MEIYHLKNILVIAFGYLLIYISFGGLQTLQSSLNSHGGLGVVSLSVIYGSQILSSVVFTPYVIRKLGCKWTVTISMCFYITYTLANFYPKWYTLIPTSVLVGLAGSPFWTAKCTYLTLSAQQRAQKENKVTMHIINQYFGIFFLIFQSARIWGNLLSSLILHLSSENACGALAVLLIYMFLDPIDLQNEKKKDGYPQYFWNDFLATLKHLQDKRQCLLIPLTIYSGIEQGFILSDYTKSYVTCSLGIKFVGYVIIIFGAMTSICSFLFGKLFEYVNRIAFFILATVINIICISVLFVWRPNPEQLGMYFVFSGLWGIADAIWQASVNALYGILFEGNREAAFANYLLWKSLGYVLSFGYSPFLCINIKLSVLIFILLVGMFCYGIVEYFEWKKTVSKITNIIVVDNFNRKPQGTIKDSVQGFIIIMSLKIIV
ncbi:protein unc-93 homolog A-like [Pelobates fuscus]|uniref:protein unc-93 homolog A-like n=1 Tax=Pelobates fuscus TaxID=191477 RepID=UPI002FE4AA0F